MTKAPAISPGPSSRAASAPSSRAGPLIDLPDSRWVPRMQMGCNASRSAKPISKRRMDRAAVEAATRPSRRGGEAATRRRGDAETRRRGDAPTRDGILTSCWRTSRNDARFPSRDDGCGARLQGREKPGRRNASRRKAARSGEYWSPGLLRPGDVEFTEPRALRKPDRLSANTSDVVLHSARRRGSLERPLGPRLAPKGGHGAALAALWAKSRAKRPAAGVQAKRRAASARAGCGAPRLSRGYRGATCRRRRAGRRPSRGSGRHDASIAWLERALALPRLSRDSSRPVT